MHTHARQESIHMLHRLGNSLLQNPRGTNFPFAAINGVGFWSLTRLASLSTRLTLAPGAYTKSSATATPDALGRFNAPTMEEEKAQLLHYCGKRCTVSKDFKCAPF